MKKYIITALAVLCVGLTATAQMRTAYFMQGSIYRTDMNPALTPLRGYVNMPFVGNMSFNLNNNFLSLDNLVYPNPNGEGTVLFLNQDVKDQFLRNLPENNALQFDTAFNLIGFGSHTKRLFWSAGVNVKAQSEMIFPKDFFSAITTLGQGHYDMSTMHACVNSYAEAFFGMAFNIGKYVTLGARVKGLLGLANIDMSVNNMYVDITDQKVEAKMSGVMKYNAIFAQEVTPGAEMKFNDLFQIGTFNFNNGYGLAFDLGAEACFFKDHLRLSVAVTDFGGIKWNKNTTINADMSAGFTYRGYDFDNKKLDTETDDLLMTIGGGSEGFMTRLNTAVNAGLEFTMLKDRISIGVMSHTKFCHTATFTELTISGNFRPLSWLSATVSHTFLNNNRLGVFGCALNIHPNGLNIFVGADFLGCKIAKGSIPIPVNMSSVNLYTGFGFNIGKPHFHRSSKFYKE